MRELAHFDVVALQPDDFVSSALVLMTKLNKRRVAVHDGERFVGILEDIDVLGFLAGSAQVIAGRIDRASTRDDLAVAARETAAQVRALRRQGVGVEVIGESSPISISVFFPDCSRCLRRLTFAPALA